METKTQKNFVNGWDLEKTGDTITLTPNDFHDKKIMTMVQEIQRQITAQEEKIILRKIHRDGLESLRRSVQEEIARRDRELDRQIARREENP